jgi:glycosyltransferase involved in cell wall biosynthesis
MVVKGKHARLIVQNQDDFVAFRQARIAPPDQIRLIRSSGVDTVRFSPSRREKKEEITRVLFAARLLWDKGIGEYVEAARHLKDGNVSVELLLAGMPDAGNPSSVSMEQIRGWEAEGLIMHLGHVTDMPKLLSEVDMAVLPSYREGAPRSLVEAAAAGLPIITTDVPGCREVVEHGVNGFLVPARQAKPLAEAIRFLHEHPEDRRRMGDAGREKAVREFDQRLVFEETHAIYRELLTYAAHKRDEKVLQD